MSPSRFIREGRMGPPKSFKSGAVVGSYPKPMLVLLFDEAGLDVLPTKEAKSTAKDQLLLDTFYEDIQWTSVTDLKNFLTKPQEQLPKVLAIDFYDRQKKLMTATYDKNTISGNPKPFQDFVDTANLLVQTGCPFKTVVLDSVTSFAESILSHIAATNGGMLADPRKWASAVGGKAHQCMSVLTTLDAHVVFLMHSQIDKSEVTGEVFTLPMINSRFRERVGALLSQFFYATKEGNKPVIYTSDRGLVKGIGARWPANLPQICGPLYTDIYKV